jgi:hypothetical protein
MKKYNITYKGRWSDDASPVSNDTKINVSHKKLVAQKQNADARGEWGRKNPDKQKRIAVSGGNKSKEIHRRKQAAKIGKKYGAENAVKYISIETKKRNGKNYGKNNLCSEVICEKCGKSVNKGNYAQSHGNKCRELDKIKLLNLLPYKFTKQIIREIALDNRIKNWEKLNLLHDTCPYTICIIKVDKPNQYNPCWYRKNKIEINKIKK